MDIRECFDKAIAVAGTFLACERIRQKRAEADALLTQRCGNCQYWMNKRICPREAVGNKQSMNSYPCDKHAIDNITMQIYQEKIADVDTLLGKK